jgi:hypothetical protein
MVKGRTFFLIRRRTLKDGEEGTTQIIFIFINLLRHLSSNLSSGGSLFEAEARRRIAALHFYLLS